MALVVKLADGVAQQDAEAACPTPRDQEPKKTTQLPLIKVTSRPPQYKRRLTTIPLNNFVEPRAEVDGSYVSLVEGASVFHLLGLVASSRLLDLLHAAVNEVSVALMLFLHGGPQVEVVLSASQEVQISCRESRGSFP